MEGHPKWANWFLTWSQEKKFVLLSLHFRLLIKNKEKKVKNLT